MAANDVDERVKVNECYFVSLPSKWRTGWQLIILVVFCQLMDVWNGRPLIVAENNSYWKSKSYSDRSLLSGRFVLE